MSLHCGLVEEISVFLLVVLVITMLWVLLPTYVVISAIQRYNYVEEIDAIVEEIDAIRESVLRVVGELDWD